MNKKFLDISTILLPWLWAGLIIGVSLIATPAKFKAETLELGTALDVGRHTFSLFIKIEWLLLLTIIVVFFLRSKSMLQVCSILILMLILTMQSFWLLPELIARAEAVIAASPKPPSLHHILYIILETIKLSTVIYLSIKEALK